MVPDGVSQPRPVVLFLVLAAVWGTAFVAIKAGLEYFPPVLFAATRFDVAGIAMLLYTWLVADRPVPHGIDQWSIVAVGATLMIGVYHVFLFIGEQYTTSAAAAVVVSLSPVLTTGLARVFLPSERLSVLGLLGLVAGLVGVGLVSQPDPANLLAPTSVGVGLIFLATAAFALGSVLTKRAQTGLEIETMETWSMLGGAVLMHLVSIGLPSESISDITWTIEAGLALGYLALVSSALGFLIYFTLLDELGPIEINLVSYVAPVFTAVFGWLLLAEQLDPLTMSGFLLILVGFALIKRQALLQRVSGVQFGR